MAPFDFAPLTRRYAQDERLMKGPDQNPIEALIKKSG